MSSIAATGFGLTAYIVGVERGFVTRDEAAPTDGRHATDVQRCAERHRPGIFGRIQGILLSFSEPEHQSPGRTERTLDDRHRTADGRYPVRPDLLRPGQCRRNEIRRLADELYRAVDWKWAMNEGELMSLGWTPESGFQPYTWQGYNEAMILYILAIGSPETDKKLDGSVWNRWTATYQLQQFPELTRW